MNTTDKFININEDLNIKWKHSDKELIVYAYALRFYENVRREGKPFYLSTKTVALLTRSSRSMGSTIINKLKASGLFVQIGATSEGTSVFKVLDWKEFPELALKSDEEYAAYFEQFNRSKERDAKRKVKYLESKANPSAEVVSEISPEPIILPVEKTVEVEQKNEPVKASDSSPIPAKVEDIVDVTDNQIEMYCKQTGQAFEDIKQALVIEPTFADYIIGELESSVKVQHGNSYFSELAMKANPHHKGSNSPDFFEEHNYQPY